MIYYAGIGSRETPQEVLSMFTALAEELAKKGAVLRSGRAGGADSAFETGCARAGGESQIFIPWASFQKNSPLAGRPAYVFDRLQKEQQKRALASIEKYHPAPEKLSQGARKLMARNYCQMFGPSTDAPASSFVVCWTKDGRASGGTGQAIRMAGDAGIRVFNARGYESRPEEFMELVCNYARTEK